MLELANWQQQKDGVKRMAIWKEHLDGSLNLREISRLLGETRMLSKDNIWLAPEV